MRPEAVERFRALPEAQRRALFAKLSGAKRRALLAALPKAERERLASELLRPEGTPERSPDEVASEPERWSKAHAESGRAPEAMARFAFLERLRPGHPAHLIGARVRLRGALDREALAAAWRDVVQRHPLLRGRLAFSEGVAQLRAPVGPLPSAAWLAREDDAEGDWRPFLLDGEDPVRLHLERLEADEHEVQVIVHHAFADAWSMGVLFRDWTQAYAARARGQGWRTGPSAGSVLEHAKREARRLASPQHEAVILQAAERLRGAPRLALPSFGALVESSEVGAGGAMARGGRTSALLSAEAWSTLRAASPGGSDFVLWVALFAAWLRRMTGQRELVFGFPVSGREDRRKAELFGLFMNTAVLRIEAEAPRAWPAWLEHVAAAVQVAQAQAELPFERVVENLGLPRDLERNPLFGILLNYGPAEELSAEVAGVHFQAEPLARDSLVELTLYVRPDPRDGSFRIAFEHRWAEHPPVRVQGWLQDLEALAQRLGEGTSDPQRAEDCVWNSPALGRSSRARLLGFGRGAAVDGALQNSVPQGIVSAASLHPERIAYEEGARALRYRDLPGAIERRAAWLRKQGLREGHLVLLAAETGLDAALAILAVQRLGAAWSPVDADMPLERLRWRIEELRPHLVLDLGGPADAILNAAQRGLLAKAELSPCSLAPYEEHEPERDPTGGEAQPFPEGSSDALAHVLYTSGSSARPKAVAVGQRALLAFLRAMQDAPGFRSKERWLASTTLSFDIAMLELFAPLLAGATVVFAERARLRDPKAYIALLRDERIDGAQATPSFWGALRAGGWELPHPVRVLSGGEALAPDLARWLLQQSAELWNLYGPTETTVWSTVERVEEGRALGIGGPIRGTRVAVLDEEGAPLGEGAIGELVIGGEGVARGYLGAPVGGRDAGPFAAGRWTELFGSERSYRTGDAGCWMPDGRLAFLGRRDAELKVRGHRVHPEEVEVQLRQHPAVEEAIVLGERPGPQVEALEAWIVPADMGDDEAAGQGLAEVSGEVAGTAFDPWSRVWRAAYAAPEGDAALDLSGWRASPGCPPLTAGRMRAWVAATAAWIAQSDPRRVLEIGCGTGLFTQRAPMSVERWDAFDPIREVVERLERNLPRGGRTHYRTAVGRAEGEWPFDDNDYDLILLNSVVQYFPSARVLSELLEAALERLSPGGQIALGDVRNLAWCPWQWRLEAQALGLRFDSDQRRRQERELCLDPWWFVAWVAAHPGARLLEMRLAPGTGDEEMTRYRFSVRIERRELGREDESAEGGAAPCQEVAWKALGSLAALREDLLASSGQGYRLRGVPNGRLDGESGLLPEGLEDLASDLHRPVSLQPDLTDASAFCAHFGPDGTPTAPAWQPDPSVESAEEPEPLATRPRRALRELELPGRLRRELAPELPKALQPARYHVLAELPRNARGKLDRQALYALRPRAVTQEAPHASAFVMRVAAAFAKELALDAVAPDADFFAQGGHSLSALRLVAALEAAGLGVLPLAQLFRTPTPRGIAHALEGSSSQVSGLSEAEASRVRPSRALLAEGQPLPTRFAEERLLLVEAIAPDPARYAMAFALWLDADAEPEGLQQALRKLSTRHDALRTRFPLGPDGEHHREILDTDVAPCDWSVEAWPERAGDREAEALRLVQALVSQPFAFEQAPPWRARLWRARSGSGEEQGRWLFACVLHHVLGDAESLRILADELASLLRGEQLRTERAERWSAADQAIVERAWMDSPEGEAALRAVEARFAGVPLALDVPTSAIPADEGQGAISKDWERLPGSEGLDAFARFLGVTPFSVLLAAWAAFVQSLGHQGPLILGTAASDRTDPRLSESVGLHVNLVPLIVRPHPDQSFAELVAATHAEGGASREWAALPFERLVRAIVQGRDLQRPPLVQWTLDLIERPREELALARLGGRRIAVPVASARFELSLRLCREAKGYAVQWEGSAQRFGQKMVEGWILAWGGLLQRAMKQPDLPLHHLPQGAPQIAAWGIPTLLESDRQSVLQRIWDAARLVPHAPAVLDADGTQWSFAELLEHACRFEGALAEHGLQDGEVVALELPRGRAFLAAALGVWRAQGAWMPLDPQDPPARRRQLLRRRGVRLVVLRDARAETSWSSFPEAPKRISWEAIEAAPAVWRDHEVAAPVVLGDQLAYVLHTSGTSGEPKAVSVSHRALAHYAEQARRHYGAARPGTSAWHAAPTVDLGLTSWLPSLMSGQGVQVLAEGEGLEPLLEGLRQGAQWSILKLTPTHLRALAPFATPERVRALANTIVVGGEALRFVDVEPFRISGGPVIWNEYGPTEATVGCIAHCITAEDPHRGPVPIGRPFAGMQARVFGEGGGEVPLHGRGRLWLSGPQLAVGVGDHRERYDTGDLVIVRPAGLEFERRADQQLSLHGRRIEPAEILAALRSELRDRSAWVGVREHRGHASLVLWVSGRPEAPDAGGAQRLREAAVERLPPALVPKHVVFVDLWPLSPSGKLLAERLPDPEEAPSAALTHELGAFGALRAAWVEVLGGDPPHAQAHFFECGGDSILALQLSARMRALGYAMRTRSLFETPRLEDLARRLEPSHHAVGAAADPGPDTAVPTPIQRYWLGLGPVAGSYWNQSAAFAVTARFAPEAMRAACAALVASEPTLRMFWDADASVFRRAAESVEGFAWLEEPQPEAADEHAAWKAFRDRVDAAIDPQAGPMIAFGAWVGEGGLRRLVVAVHHLVIDAWSWLTLIERLEALLSHPESAAGLRRVPPHSRIAERLARLPQVVEQAADPLPQGLRPKEASAQELLFELPEDLISSLAARRSEAGASWTATFASAWAYAVRETLGDPPERLWVEGRGRDLADLLEALREEGEGACNAEDLEGVVGWMTSLAPHSVHALADGVVARLAGRQPSLEGFAPRDSAALLELALRPPASGDLALNVLPEAAALRSPALSGDQAVLEHLPEALRRARDPRRLRPFRFELDLQARGGAFVGSLSFDSRDRREELAGLQRVFVATLERFAQEPPEPLGQASSPAASSVLEGALTSTPLNSTQLGMLYHRWERPETAAYFEQSGVCLGGPVEEARLRGAIAALQARHKALRSVFTRDAEGDVIQLTGASAPLPLVVERLEDDGLTGAEADEAALRFDRARPLALLDGLPWRVTLFVGRAKEHRLLWTWHHALFDGWSAMILLRDLVLAYEGKGFGDATPDPAQHASWRASQDASAGRVFWQRHLQGLPESLALDGAWPPQRPFEVEGFERSCHLSAPQSSALMSSLKEHGLTLSTLVQGAWASLLAEANGADEALFAMTVSGRPDDLPGAAGMVGLFLGTVLKRVPCERDATLGEWLHAIQARQARETTFEHVPLAEQERAAGGRHPRSLVVIENYPIDDALRSRAASLEVLRSFGFERTAEAITLAVVPGEQLELRLLVGSGACVPNAAERLLQRLRRALLAVPAAWKGSLREWWRGFSDAPAAKSLPTPSAAMREEAAAWLLGYLQRLPESWRLEGEGQALGRREVRQRILSLIARGRSLGLQEGAVVALDADPSLDCVLGHLAALHAGWVTLPIDPHLPERRQAQLLRRCAAVARLGPLATRLGDGFRALPHIAMGEGGSEEEEVSQPLSKSGDARFALYPTSGTSGHPKLVPLRRAGLGQYARAAAERYGLRSGDRILHAASFAFDTALEEVHLALAAGADLLVRSPQALSSGRALEHEVRERRVSVLDLPTAWWNGWSEAWDEASVAALAGVRVLILGGQAPDLAALERWFERFPGPSGPELWNTYGPTEGTIVCSAALLKDPGASGWREGIPIGRALAGCELRVEDSEGREVGPDRVGELVLRGLGVSEPWLHAEGQGRFLREEQGWAYRTGDRVWRRPDGELVFVGRQDEQVKVRGQRIELSGVEELARGAEGVADARASLLEGPAAEAKDCLHLWVRPAKLDLRASERDALSARVTERLRERLPPVACPQAVHCVVQWPRTAGGKIDLARLRDDLVSTGSQTARRAPLSASKAPQGETEEALVAIFKELLGRTEVGRHDGFFASGGDSIALVRLLGRSERRFGVGVDLPAVLAADDVASLAAQIDAARASSGREGAKPEERRLAEPSSDWRARARLPESYAVPSRGESFTGSRAHGQRVLMTGATGSLGAQVLREVLTQEAGSPAHEELWCLVRARDDDHARRRLLEVLGVQFRAVAERAFATGRLVALPGDVTRPQLGLPAARHAALAARCDASWNVGAATGFFESFERLACVNVEGLLRLLELTEHGRPKRFVQVSTVGIFDAAVEPPGRRLDEGEPLAAWQHLEGPYPQSKWVAERILELAEERGLEVRVVRPGRIVAAGGQPAVEDFAGRIVRLCAELAAVPELELAWDAVPVDGVARDLLALARAEQAPRVAHLLAERPYSLDELRERLAGTGPPWERLPLETWWRRARAHLDVAADHPLAALQLLPAFRDPKALQEALTAPRPRIMATRTRGWFQR